MKNLILLFMLALLGSAAFSQTNQNVSTTNYIYSYTGVAAKDTVGATVTTWGKAITFGVPQAAYYNVKVKVTETAGFAGTGKLTSIDASLKY